MAQLHFDCFSGISGDMILGALVHAGLPFKELVRTLKAVPIEGYELRIKHVLRGSLHATKVDVLVREGFRTPVSLGRIERIIAGSRLPEPVKDRSRAVFEHLAKAEGIAHRVGPSEVQFHEVGAMDSIVDVIGSLAGCHLLGVERATASSVNLGSGMTDSAHGRLPVPGPAVAALARGIPVHSAGPPRELATPTGIALLRTLVQAYGPLPPMRPDAVGYGAGTADPEGWPNVLRVFLGQASPALHGDSDSVIQIETNLDDVNPQTYELIMDRLFAAGALDVTLTPVIMKQGRPGVVLAALAARETAEAVADVVLRETTTLGVRMQELSRRVLPRRFESVRIRGGQVRIKVAQAGPDGRKAAPEYRDCKRIAQQTGRPVREIMEEALLAFAGKAKAKAKGKK